MLITRLRYPFNQIEKINSGDGPALLVCVTRLLIQKHRRGASRRLNYFKKSYICNIKRAMLFITSILIQRLRVGGIPTYKISSMITQMQRHSTNSPEFVEIVEFVEFAEIVEFHKLFHQYFHPYSISNSCCASFLLYSK